MIRRVRASAPLSLTTAAPVERVWVDETEPASLGSPVESWPDRGETVRTPGTLGADLAAQVGALGAAGQVVALLTPRPVRGIPGRFVLWGMGGWRPEASGVLDAFYDRPMMLELDGGPGDPDTLIFYGAGSGADGDPWGDGTGPVAGLWRAPIHGAGSWAPMATAVEAPWYTDFPFTDHWEYGFSGSIGDHWESRGWAISGATSYRRDLPPGSGGAVAGTGDPPPPIEPYTYTLPAPGDVVASVVLDRGDGASVVHVDSTPVPEGTDMSLTFFPGHAYEWGVLTQLHAGHWVTPGHEDDAPLAVSTTRVRAVRGVAPVHAAQTGAGGTWHGGGSDPGGGGEN